MEQRTKAESREFAAFMTSIHRLSDLAKDLIDYNCRRPEFRSVLDEICTGKRSLDKRPRSKEATEWLQFLQQRLNISCHTPCFAQTSQHDPLPQ